MPSCHVLPPGARWMWGSLLAGQGPCQTVDVHRNDWSLSHWMVQMGHLYPWVCRWTLPHGADIQSVPLRCLSLPKALWGSLHVQRSSVQRKSPHPCANEFPTSFLLLVTWARSRFLLRNNISAKRVMYTHMCSLLQLRGVGHTEDWSLETVSPPATELSLCSHHTL